MNENLSDHFFFPRLVMIVFLMKSKVFHLKEIRIYILEKKRFRYINEKNLKT